MSHKHLVCETRAAQQKEILQTNYVKEAKSHPCQDLRRGMAKYRDPRLHPSYQLKSPKKIHSTC